LKTKILGEWLGNNNKQYIITKGGSSYNKTHKLVKYSNIKLEMCTGYYELK